MDVSLSMFKNTDKRWIWLGLGITMVLLRYILGFYPEMIERFYSRGLYIGIRWILDYTVAFLPVPSLYVFIFSLLFWGLYRLFRKRKAGLLWWQRILQFLFSTLAFLSGVVFFFLVLWGFNYGRIPLEDQIDIKPKPLDRRELLEELSFFTPKLMENRRLVSTDSFPLDAQDLPEDLHPQIRKVVEANLLDMGYPDAGEPRLRQLRPQGVLLRISTAGFYMPLTGECHVDAGLHPIQLPFVMAHEYYHAYGFTDEGSCNFMAFLACIRSEDAFIRYAGYMGYWRYLAGGYRQADRKIYGSYYRSLPLELRKDLKAIRDRMDEFPDILPEVRNLAYNTYLKAQGIEEGIKNYSRIVMLAAAWRKKEKNDLLPK
ncbi:MAG: DUF3810 domain-containing protein [Bacteroidota bacterium]